MRLVYVTSRYPFGPGEAFLGPEIAAHIAAGTAVSVFPSYPRGQVVHDDASAILPRTSAPGARRAAATLAATVLGEPQMRRLIARTLRDSRPLRIRAKNGVVLARAGALVSHLRRVEAEHVHVHWGGTSSTLAMIAAETVAVPWSLTVHRWDIYENNLLTEKVGRAAFTRVISGQAAGDVRALVPAAEPIVLHMGVDVPAEAAPVPSGSGCRLVCIASLVPVKDHASLLAAFATLDDADVTLELVGAGPLERDLRRRVDELGLTRRVIFAGLLDHRAVLARLQSGAWDGVVLTSSTGASEHEGIPVSLMEAMAAGVPALATDSGATRELVGDGAGLLVPAGERDALAADLRRFVADADLRRRLADAARTRVEDAFDAVKIAARLRELFAEPVSD
jgi:glycosyltransferase involved in cell wall biosynthesis